MPSIVDLLQQKSTKVVAYNITKNARNDWKQADISIFQFFIDIFGKEFQFTEEHYDEMDESTVNLQALVLEIYESDTTNEEYEDEELKLKEFMKHIINELFVNELLSDSIVSNWVTFLASIAEHDTIPKVSRMRGCAHLLLTLILAPFSYIISIYDNLEFHASEELKTAIERSIERIFNIIPASFEYEKYSLMCAKEYTETLNEYHAILLNNSTYLQYYRNMLSFDNRPLLVMALNGIEELCEKESLEDVMKEFLFTSQNDENVVDIIVKLINFKNLRHEVIKCLKAISKFQSDHEVIKSDSYCELFMNLFSKSKKTILETAQLIASLELNFWLELIKMLNYYTIDDFVDIKCILTSIDKFDDKDLEEILQVIVNHINEPAVSRRGAEIFNEAFELSTSKEENLAALINTMHEVCKEDEITFIVLLQSFISLNDELLTDFLKNNVNFLTQILMPTISNAFLRYEKPNSMSYIVTALRKLHKIEPVTIVLRVRDIAKQFSNILLNCEPVEFKEREKMVPRLSALFECKSWRIADDSLMLNLYNFCQKNCTNINYNYFPVFQRFYINLIKHFWMRLANNKSILIDAEKFIKDTRNIYNLILNASKSSRNSIQDNCLLLSSLIDLYILFQPKITEKLKNDFFKRFNIPLSKEDFIKLIDQMERSLFPESEESSFYQQLLLQSFVTLSKNYINLPGLTSWEVFLRYYTAKSMYKTEVELLMIHAIGTTKKAIFEKSVAFAILNIAVMSGMDQFRTFFSAFDEFMHRQFPDYKARNIVYAVICSVVLEKLPHHIALDDWEENSDRLVVLDFIRIMMKNSDQSFSKNLVKFINVNENTLTDIEIRKLNDFKRMLLNEDQ